MKIEFSNNKPVKEGFYLLKYKNGVDKYYVGRQLTTSSQFDMPFNYGLSVIMENKILGTTEHIPVEWIQGQWSEKLEF